MRIRALIPLTSGLAVLSALVGTSWAGGDAPTEIVWHKSYAEARKAAKDTGKSLVVEFR